MEDNVQKFYKELSYKINKITNILDSKEEINKSIIEKDRELKEFELKLSKYPLDVNEGEKLMTVNFTSIDRRI